MRRIIVAILLCGALLGCTKENLFFEHITELDSAISTTDEVSVSEVDCVIAHIVEDLIAEYQGESTKTIFWGTVVIMDVESGYTRTINCCADDIKIGDSEIDYAHEPIHQGSAFLPIPFLSLLDEGGVQLSDAVDIDSPRKQIGGVLVVDPYDVDVATYGEAFINGSNIAIVQGCYDILKLKSVESLYSAMGYQRKLSPVKMLRAYNVIANRGKYVDVKYSVDAPTKVLEESMYSERAVGECKRCMVQHAIDRQMEGVATYSGVSQILYDTRCKDGHLGRSTYLTTHVGLFPIDNPKYSVLVSFYATSPMMFLGNQAIPSIIEVLD